MCSIRTLSSKSPSTGDLVHVVMLLAALSLVALSLAVPAQAQPATFEKAQEAYRFGEYETAVDLFSEVAQNSAIDKDIRREALHYLGRSFIARDKRDQAREAIRTLLELEPPLVELDPNVEPPPIMDLYYEVRKEMEGYAVQKADSGLQTLAIMDFSNSSVDEKERFDPLQKGFPAMMINYMSGATDLKVIERERIQWLLNELELQRQGDIVDQSTAVRTGKVLGANAVVFGSYTVHEDQMLLTARVVKVETSEIMLSEQAMGEPDEFFDLVKDLSMQITRAINVELEEDQLGAGQTNSLDAMMAYSDGLDELEDGNYRAAYEQFLRAAELDPNYRQAELKAQSLHPMLASASTGGSGNMNR